MIIHSTKLDTQDKVIAAYGGITWVLLSEGQVLLAGSKSGSYKVGSSYGSNTQTLTVNQIPAHTHGQKTVQGSFTQRSYGTNNGQMSWGGGIVSVTRNNATAGYAVAAESHNVKMDTVNINASHEHSSVGGGQAHSVMQKSMAVYIWHRTV